MFTGAALVSGAGDGKEGMLEGLVIEKLNGWDIEKRYGCGFHCFCHFKICRCAHCLMIREYAPGRFG